MGTPEANQAQTLLVPLDGSKLAEAVLPAVEAIASRAHAPVLLLHVLERNAPTTIHGDRHLGDATEAQTYLQEVGARLSAAGITVETHVHDAREADVARSIVEHAGEHGTSLVVLCTHGSGGLRDLLFGSIAQQVMQRGGLSVLLIRPGPQGAAPSFDIRSVLVPLDGTPAHEPAFDAAARIASLFGASIHLAMVIPTVATLSGGEAATGVLLPGVTKAVLDLAEQGARDYLASVGKQSQGCAVIYEVLRGDPVPAVLDLARRSNADLLVMGSHGRAGLDALIAGSVARRIADKVTTPILLVRAAEPEGN